MATPSLFLKIKFSPNKIKKVSFCHWVGTYPAKYGVHKMATPLGNFFFRGSNLNSSWEKCGVWLVDQWIPLFMCFCMIGCWLHVESFDMFILDACLAIIVHWRCSHVDYIDWYSYLPFIVTLFVVWLSCFPGHVYSHFCISHSSWHDWFYLLYIILFISTYCLFLLYSYLAYHILA